MSSKPRSLNQIRAPQTKRRSLRRRLKPHRRIFPDPKAFRNAANTKNEAQQQGQKNLVGGGGVVEKLEALKNLIPSKTGEVKADRLFEETADYIVFLRTQVQILQKLIDFYESPSSTPPTPPPPPPTTTPTMDSDKEEAV